MLAANWKMFLYITILMALMNGVSHGTQDLYPTLLKRDWGFQTTAVVMALNFIDAYSRFE